MIFSPVLPEDTEVTSSADLKAIRVALDFSTPAVLSKTAALVVAKAESEANGKVHTVVTENVNEHLLDRKRTANSGISENQIDDQITNPDAKRTKIEIESAIKQDIVKVETTKVEKMPVYVRIREASGISHLEARDNHSITMTVREKPKTFKLDRVFDSDFKQSHIFTSVAASSIQDFIRGDNALIFAYGVSDSGKTFTIHGNPKNPGLIPRSLCMLFRSLDGKLATNKQIRTKHELAQPRQKGTLDGNNPKFKKDELSEKDMILKTNFLDGKECLANLEQYLNFYENTNIDKVAVDDECTYSVWISFCELYLHSAKDLLLKNEDDLKIKNRTAAGKGNNFYIDNLSCINVDSIEEAYKLMMLGENNRKTSATHLNKNSSRSHGIFTIKIVSTKKVIISENGASKRGSIVKKESIMSFVDLAGSEKSNMYGKTDRTIHNEMVAINRSLVTLNQCIRQRNAGEKISYRDSLLTTLFSNFFENGYSMKMVVNINPTAAPNETAKCLEFASNEARRMKIRKNDIAKQKLDARLLSNFHLRLKSLQEENQKLKNDVQRLKREKNNLEARSRTTNISNFSTIKKAPKSQLSFVSQSAIKSTTRSKFNQQVLESARTTEKLNGFPARPCMECERLSKEIKTMKESRVSQIKDHQLQNLATSDSNLKAHQITDEDKLRQKLKAELKLEIEEELEEKIREQVVGELEANGAGWNFNDLVCSNASQEHEMRGKVKQELRREIKAELKLEIEEEVEEKIREQIAEELESSVLENTECPKYTNDEIATIVQAMHEIQEERDIYKHENEKLQKKCNFKQSSIIGRDDNSDDCSDESKDCYQNDGDPDNDTFICNPNDKTVHKQSYNSNSTSDDDGDDDVCSESNIGLSCSEDKNDACSNNIMEYENGTPQDDIIFDDSSTASLQFKMTHKSNMGSGDIVLDYSDAITCNDHDVPTHDNVNTGILTDLKNFVTDDEGHDIGNLIYDPLDSDKNNIIDVNFNFVDCTDMSNNNDHENTDDKLEMNRISDLHFESVKKGTNNNTIDGGEKNLDAYNGDNTDAVIKTLSIENIAEVQIDNNSHLDAKDNMDVVKNDFLSANDNSNFDAIEGTEMSEELGKRNDIIDGDTAEVKNNIEVPIDEDNNDSNVHSKVDASLGIDVDYNYVADKKDPVSDIDTPEITVADADTSKDVDIMENNAKVVDFGVEVNFDGDAKISGNVSNISNIDNLTGEVANIDNTMDADVDVSIEKRLTVGADTDVAIEESLAVDVDDVDTEEGPIFSADMDVAIKESLTVAADVDDVDIEKSAVINAKENFFGLGINASVSDVEKPFVDLDVNPGIEENLNVGNFATSHRGDTLCADIIYNISTNNVIREANDDINNFDTSIHTNAESDQNEDVDLANNLDSLASVDTDNTFDDCVADVSVDNPAAVGNDPDSLTSIDVDHEGNDFAHIGVNVPEDLDGDYDIDNTNNNILLNRNFDNPLLGIEKGLVVNTNEKFATSHRGDTLRAEIIYNVSTNNDIPEVNVDADNIDTSIITNAISDNNGDMDILTSTSFEDSLGADDNVDDNVDLANDIDTLVDTSNTISTGADHDVVAFGNYIDSLAVIDADADREINKLTHMDVNVIKNFHGDLENDNVRDNTNDNISTNGNIGSPTFDTFIDTNANSDDNESVPVKIGTRFENSLQTNASEDDSVDLGNNINGLAGDNICDDSVVNIGVDNSVAVGADSDDNIATDVIGNNLDSLTDVDATAAHEGNNLAHIGVNVAENLDAILDGGNFGANGNDNILTDGNLDHPSVHSILHKEKIPNKMAKVIDSHFDLISFDEKANPNVSAKNEEVNDQTSDIFDVLSFGEDDSSAVANLIDISDEKDHNNVASLKEACGYKDHQKQLELKASGSDLEPLQTRLPPSRPVGRSLRSRSRKPINYAHDIINDEDYESANEHRGKKGSDSDEDFEFHDKSYAPERSGRPKRDTNKRSIICISESDSESEDVGELFKKKSRSRNKRAVIESESDQDVEPQKTNCKPKRIGKRRKQTVIKRENKTESEDESLPNFTKLKGMTGRRKKQTDIQSESEEESIARENTPNNTTKKSFNIKTEKDKIGVKKEGRNFIKKIESEGSDTDHIDENFQKMLPTTLLKSKSQTMATNTSKNTFSELSKSASLSLTPARKRRPLQLDSAVKKPIQKEQSKQIGMISDENKENENRESSDEGTGRKTTLRTRKTNALKRGMSAKLGTSGPTTKPRKRRLNSKKTFLRK